MNSPYSRLGNQGLYRAKLLRGTWVNVQKKFEELEDLLLAHRLVNHEQILNALKAQRVTQEPLGDLLVSQGAITEEQLLKVLAASSGVAPWNLKKERPATDAVTRLPIELCRKYQMLPVQVRGDLLLVAMRNPQDGLAIETARNVSGLRVEPVLANESRLQRAIEQFAEGAREGRCVEALVAKAMLEVSGSRFSEDESHALGEIDTRPVVGLVNQIFTDAIRMRASDIHLEPRSNSVEVRYRLDGQLSLVQEFPSVLLPMVAARIKIMAELDIVEHRLPQDGRITAKLDRRDIDMRVSVLPNHHGPRIVLRILDRSATLKPLSQLGFSEHNLEMFRKFIVKPHGMILVTGPTGSGKTTTLYAALNEIKSEATNIMTCEDPIEYDIAGINQSQVNEKVGLTFGAQLRATLRQDPDVVLVGEIRDLETAEIAIRASMTGHLVFSTLHTNDAPGAIPRLVDIGVKPYLIATSVIGIMAQRLVRCLCPECKQHQAPTHQQAALMDSVLGNAERHRVYRAVGCPACFGTGYRGRIALNEMLPVTPEMQRLIASGATTEELRHEGARYGFRTMQFDAMQRVVSGETSFEEAARVVFLEDYDAGPAQLRVA